MSIHITLFHGQTVIHIALAAHTRDERPTQVHHVWTDHCFGDRKI